MSYRAHPSLESVLSLFCARGSADLTPFCLHQTYTTTSTSVKAAKNKQSRTLPPGKVSLFDKTVFGLAHQVSRSARFYLFRPMLTSISV